MKPDLVFLDIEMPGNSGLEILNYFDENEVNFEIVFITAYSEYAVEAFKLSAADYLLKPISDDILVKTVNKIILKNERIQSKKNI
jgi:two-component system, LytTR family, response regulator